MNYNVAFGNFLMFKKAPKSYVKVFKQLFGEMQEVFENMRSMTTPFLNPIDKEILANPKMTKSFNNGINVTIADDKKAFRVTIQDLVTH